MTDTEAAVQPRQRSSQSRRPVSAAPVAPFRLRGNLPSVLLLGGLALAVFAAGWNVPPPVVNAERRCVAINRTMYETGDLLIPRLEGRMHLTKPPLFHWLSWGLSSLKGGGALGSVRLVSAFASVAVVLLTYAIGLLLYGSGPALTGGLLLLTTLGFLNHGHRGTFDALLAAFVCLTILGYLLGRHPERRTLGPVLMVTGLIGGFLTKGFMGWLAPLLPIAADWLVRTRGRRRCWGRIVLFVPVVLVFSLAWYAYLVFRVPEARVILEDVVTVNFGVRHTGVQMAFHRAPFWYYLTETPIFLLPWSLILLPLFFRYRRSWSDWWRGPDRLPLLWFLLNILFLSLVPAKAGRYLVPVIPAFSLMAGSLLCRAYVRDGLGDPFWRKWLAVLLFLLGLTGLTVLPVWLWVRPGEPLVVCLAAGVSLAVGLIVAGYFCRRNQCFRAVQTLALIFALAFIPAYAVWIPRHNLLRSQKHQHHAPERRRYEQRKKRLKNLFRFANERETVVGAPPRTGA